MSASSSRNASKTPAPRYISRVRRKAGLAPHKRAKHDKSIYEAVAGAYPVPNTPHDGTIQSNDFLIQPSKASKRDHSTAFPSSSSSSSQSPPNSPNSSDTRDSNSPQSHNAPPNPSPQSQPHQASPADDEPTTDPTDLLPSSDLLTAIHSYASDYYAKSLPHANDSEYHDANSEIDTAGAAAAAGRTVDEICHRGMDGTALIAMGVLLEELCRDVLGEMGDLVFADEEEEEDEEEEGEEEEGDVAEELQMEAKRPAEEEIPEEVEEERTQITTPERKIQEPEDTITNLNSNSKSNSGSESESESETETDSVSSSASASKPLHHHHHHDDDDDDDDDDDEEEEEEEEDDDDDEEDDDAEEVERYRYNYTSEDDT